jgi:hypothetical protein
MKRVMSLIGVFVMAGFVLAGPLTRKETTFTRSDCKSKGNQ